jgi:diguanylate cyclase (GGDEF)-like protein/PAS domain S-box-containing protein
MPDNDPSLSDEMARQIEAQRQAQLRGDRLDVVLGMIRMYEARENDIARFTLEGAIKVTFSQIGHLAFLDDQGQVLTLLSWLDKDTRFCSMQDASCRAVIEDAKPWAEAVRLRRPVIDNDYQIGGQSGGVPPGSSLPAKRLLSVPVFQEGKAVVVACTGDKTTEYTEADAKILSVLMEYMWQIFLNKRNMEAVREGREMFQAIFDSINDGVLIQDQKSGNIVRANRRAGQMFGIEENAFPGMSLCSLFSGEYPYTPELAERYLRKAVEEGFQLLEWQAHGRDGDPFWAEVSMKPFPFDGKQFVVVVLRDISKRKRLEDNLRDLTLKDRLTGLANKTLLFERIGQAIKRKSRNANHNFCVIYIDLERFKLINDRYGYSTGDEILHQVADRLTSCIRSIDTVSRYGSDDFIVLLDGFDASKTAISILKRILEVIGQEIVLEPNHIHLTSTVGMVFGTGAETDPAELISKASVAMHRAQEKSRHRFRVYCSGMKKIFDRKISFEHDLEQAIEAGELFMVYQPIVFLASGRWNGLEALLRWRHRDHGLVSPSEFIPILENSRKMPLLETFVINHVVADIRRFAQADVRFNELEVAINISARHFMKFEFISKIGGLLDAFESSTYKLCFEMTETSMMTEGGFDFARYDILRARGFKIAIDDFGTGYSSLSYLSQLPVDKVKIDRKFIQNLENNLSDRKITKAIIGLAQDLGFLVVAEGVETAGQRDLLLSFGCEFAQGFYFARPMPPEEILRRFAL